MNEKINECLKTLNEVSVEIVSLEQQLAGKKNVYRHQSTRLTTLFLKYGVEVEPPEEDPIPEEPLENPTEEEEEETPSSGDDPPAEEDTPEDQVDEDKEGSDKPSLEDRRTMSFCPYCGKCQRKYKKVGDNCERPDCTAKVVSHHHKPTWKK